MEAFDFLVEESHTYERDEQMDFSAVVPVSPRGGNPSHFHPDFCELIIELARYEGAWFYSAIAEIGISRNTADRWLREYPEFASAKDLADTECERFYQKVGVLGMLKKKDIDSGMWKFLMQNVTTFKDKAQVDHKAVVFTATIGNSGRVEKEKLEGADALRLIAEADEQTLGLDEMESDYLSILKEDTDGV